MKYTIVDCALSLLKKISPSLSIVFLIFQTNVVDAQVERIEKDAIHRLSLKTHFAQLKDQYNYGLVHHGLNLSVAYTYEKDLAKNTWIYSPELSFGVGYNKGIGLNWKFKPIDIFYGTKINHNRGIWTLGGYGASNYSWQLYPELQSGRMFWATSLEIGAQASYDMSLKNRAIRITLSSSWFGWNSRPNYSNEQYYYSLTRSDFISNAHQDLSFASMGKFNHTNIEIGIKPKPKKRFSLAYEFDYFGYYESPSFYSVFHSINFTWKLGKL